MDREIMEADFAATLEGFRTDMTRGREEAERRDKESVHRETRLILVIALIVGVALTIFGFLTAGSTP